MDARVILSRETRHKLANPALDDQGRKKIRITRVIEFIDKIPAGKLAANADIIAAAGYNIKDANDYAKGNYFINKLVKDGVIERDMKPYAKFAHYKVKKTTPQAIQRVKPGYSLEQLEADAKEYSWVENSDSLRAFIQYIKEKSNG